MFTNVSIALVAAVGAGGWIYAKMYRSSGGDNKSALTVASIGGFIAFLLILGLAGLFFK